MKLVAIVVDNEAKSLLTVEKLQTSVSRESGKETATANFAMSTSTASQLRREEIRGGRLSVIVCEMGVCKVPRVPIAHSGQRERRW
jgi:hypothetical protein